MADVSAKFTYPPCPKCGAEKYSITWATSIESVTALFSAEEGPLDPDPHTDEDIIDDSEDANLQLVMQNSGEVVVRCVACRELYAPGLSDDGQVVEMGDPVDIRDTEWI